MDLAQALRVLWKQKRWLAVGAVLAALAAISTVYDVHGFPPRFEKQTYAFGTATTQILVDAPSSPVVNLSRQFDPLTTRAGIYARLIDTVPVKTVIAKLAGIPPYAIITGGPPLAGTDRGREVTPAQRTNELLGEGGGYRIYTSSREGLPIITVTAQAPDALSAVKLADSTAQGLKNYVVALQVRDNTNLEDRVELKQLGSAGGGLVNSTTDRKAAALAGIGVFGFVCVLILLIAYLRRSWHDPELVVAPPGSSNGHRRIEGTGAVRTDDLLPERTDSTVG